MNFLAKVAKGGPHIQFAAAKRSLLTAAYFEQSSALSYQKRHRQSVLRLGRFAWLH